MSVKHNTRQLKKKIKKTPETQMRICELKNIQTIDEVYDAMQASICLPKYFGRNLDALYNSLSLDVPGPFTIRWLDHRLSEEALGELYYEGLMDILHAIARERSDATIELSQLSHKHLIDDGTLFAATSSHQEKPSA